VSLYRLRADNEIAVSTRPEVIAAAEAVRLWIHHQRARWPTQPLTPSLRPAAAAVAVSGAGVLSAAAPAPTISIPDGSAALAVASPRFAVAKPALQRGAMFAGAAAAAVVMIAAVGLAARRAWSSYENARGTAIITSTPSGAEVVVDGMPVGPTPLNLQLATGRHTLELRRRNSTFSGPLEIGRNRESSVHVDLNGRSKGRLKVQSDPPGAHVLVDGRDVGVAPLTVSDITVGSHTVVLESAEGSVRRRVQITETSTEELFESIFPGWVRVSAPVEVTVSADGKPVQLDSGNRAMLKPGLHQLRLDNAVLGFSELQKVEVEPGATTQVSVDAPVSTLNVTSNAPADITIDGAKVGETPIINLTVKVGTRTIVAVDRLGNQQRLTVTVTSRPANVEISFPKP
jgi:hypothetical protein